MAYITRRELDEQRNQRLADAQQSAHDRFVRGRTNFIESNSNAVSPSERANFLGRQRQIEDEDRMREAEMKMLQQRGMNALAVEGEKARGMVGQGSEAAKANSDATKYAADAQKEAALRKAEVEMAASRALHGYFDDSGIYHPGSEVAKTESASKATLENARLEREARIESAERMAQGRLGVAEINAGAKITAAKTGAEQRAAAAAERADAADQRAFDTWLLNLNDPLKSAGISADERARIDAMTPEEKRAYWQKMTGRAE